MKKKNKKKYWFISLIFVVESCVLHTLKTTKKKGIDILFKKLKPKKNYTLLVACGLMHCGMSEINVYIKFNKHDY